MIWADDLLLLSKSNAGLQNMLSELKQYTETNGMKLNLKKTKVMIFNKNGRHMRRNFFFGDDRIETTRQYKYLGFMVTPSGEITTGLKDLKDRANRAIGKLKKKQGIFFKKSPLINMKLFKALVEPILLYASDFWGILNHPKNSPIETIHMSFCKQLLGVQKQTSNVGVLLELGQTPLILSAVKNAIKNWVRIANRTHCNELTLKSHENAIRQNLTWPNKIEQKISEIGLRVLFLEKDKNTHAKVFERQKDIFHQNSFSKINGADSKLKTYSAIKSSVGREDYLSIIQNTKERIAFTKFRLSNHELMIEKGRHMKIEKRYRLCPFCPTEVEDEQHFLLKCPIYNHLREELFINILHILPDFYIHPNEKFLFWFLLKCPLTLQYSAHFISQAEELRSFIVAKHKNTW